MSVIPGLFFLHGCRWLHFPSQAYISLPSQSEQRFVYVSSVRIFCSLISVFLWPYNIYLANDLTNSIHVVSIFLTVCLSKLKFSRPIIPPLSHALSEFCKRVLNVCRVAPLLQHVSLLLIYDWLQLLVQLLCYQWLFFL